MIRPIWFCVFLLFCSICGIVDLPIFRLPVFDGACGVEISNRLGQANFSVASLVDPPVADPSNAWIQDSIETSDSEPDSQPVESAVNSEQTGLPAGTSIGIAGHVRLGFWTEISCPADQLPTEGEMVIRAVDGDGIPVDYRWDLRRIQRGEQQVVVGHFRLGQLNHRVRVQILDQDKVVVRSQDLDFQADPELHLHSATKLFWLTLGEDIGVNAVTNSLQRLSDGGMVLIETTDIEKLPVTERGWQSLNRLVAQTGSEGENGWVNQLTQPTSAALAKWLRSGGRFSLALGTDSVSLLKDSGSLSSITGEIEGVVRTTRKSSPIEFYVGSRSQLLADDSDPLPLVVFPPTPGADLDVDNGSLIARYSVGLGEVDLLGLDLNDPVLATWPSRNNLTSKWLQVEKPTETRLNSTYGYSDLSGQLRSALDQFQRVSLISFSTVAGILIGFLLLVAADYFLMRHVIKRMQMTWISLPIYCLLACGAVAWLFQAAKSPQVLANQAEVVDIDAVNGTVEGRVWANIYSPVADNLDLTLARTNQLGLTAEDREIQWNGLAGTGMGGMMSTKLMIGSDRPYSVTQADDATEAGGELSSRSLQIQQMPFDVASTRSLRGHWNGSLPFTVSSRLNKKPGRDRLYGTFTNPLPIEMKNCFIINGGWAYQFRSTLPPNATVDITSQTDHIALSVWLTRRRSVSDNSSTNQAWNPIDNDLQRILELLMFYDLANGLDYTSLLNQYESDLDLGSLRNLDRAIFLGRTSTQVTEIQLNGQGLEQEQFDQSASAVRMILPVGIQADK